MKERYSNELPKWMKFFGVQRINAGSIESCLRRMESERKF